MSNLSFLSKVVECAVLKQFTEHCTRNDLIPDYQSAYQSNYSCKTALVKIVNGILWSMENQECTNLMAIDLSAAFDMVDHVILLDVLQKRFGIEGVALSWFDNYLHPHFCKVNIGKAYSSSRELE